MSEPTVTPLTDRLCVCGDRYPCGGVHSEPTVTPLTAEELHRRETDRLEARLWANDDGPTLAGYRQLAFDAISLLKDSTFLDAARTDCPAETGEIERLRRIEAAAKAYIEARDVGDVAPIIRANTALRTALSKEERP